MPKTITALLYDPAGTAEPTTGPATPQGDNSWTDWATTPAVTLTGAALTAAIITGLAVYLWMRRPGKADLSKHLMYVPLLLVNAAAIYGQVAFFYESVAPATWPLPGKLILAIVIALAIESIALYVGWHAHDSLLNKAGVAAQRRRRASYLIALGVGVINYTHFADGSPWQPTSASFAFGLLSLVSPWLWGMHTRRVQHVQLVKEGKSDSSGAVFSAEKHRMFPLLTHQARRWSVFHNVSDPDEAWTRFIAEREAKMADTAGRRLRGAWLVLSGHATAAVTGQRKPLRADITVGHAADTATGHPADMRAVTAPDTRPDIDRTTGQDTSADNPAASGQDTTADTVEDTRPDTNTPTRRTPRPPRMRPIGRTPDRTPKWTKDQLKVFKLKDTRPDMTYPQIAREVGVSDKTVSRWMKAREAADSAEERPAATDILPTFDLQKPHVLEGVNGNHPTLTKEMP